MKNKFKNAPCLSYRFKDKQFIVKQIIKQVENGTGLSINALKIKYSEEMFFLVSFKYVTTTKKALCKALDINIDNACRYKRDAEKDKLLVQSALKYSCPYTGRKANYLSTDSNEFHALRNT